MSNKTTQKDEEKTVTATDEDVTAIRSFFKHFNLESNKPLEEALDAFQKEKTLVNQERVRDKLAKAIYEDKSGLFKDKMFAPLFANSEKRAYYDAFDTQLETHVDKNPEDKS